MKIAVMGDSISQGIGSKKINYAKILEKKYIVKNFALTGTTTEYGLEIIDNIVNFGPDLVILFYGNVDALPRVKSNTCFYSKIMPKRYKQLGMLDPRALYSSNKIKRIPQRLDSEFRYRLKNLLVRVQGYEQWVNIHDFEKNYKSILEKLLENNIKVITISNVPICERYFKNSNYEYRKYNNVIKELSYKYNCRFINLYSILSKYNDVFLDDLYHPNKKGYEIIASLIEKEIN